MAAELEPALERLRGAMTLGEPFRDPGVGEFGLDNAVCALGDTFLEIVSPIADGTAAGRHLRRLGGDGGYMLIFQLDDLAAARERAAALGVRTVWQIDLPDMAGTHLHPGDMGGTIVSLDRPEPAGAWRWGGPDWTARVGQGPPGVLAGAVVEVADPAAVAERWATVLGVPGPDGEPTLQLDGATLRFAPGERGLVEIDLDAPSGAEIVSFGSVTVRPGP